MTVLKTLAATGAQADNTVVSATLVPGFSATGFSIGSGNAFTFQSSVATGFGMTYGYRMNQAAANQITTYIDLASPETGIFAWREYFRYQNTPVNTVVRRFYPDSTHAVNAGSMTITSTNRMQFVEGGAGTPLSVTSTGTAMTPGSYYAGMGKIDLAANTFTYTLYPLASATQVFTITGTLGADMAAATGLQSMRVGINTATSGIGNYELGGDTAVGNGGFLPRTDISNVLPVAGAGADVTVEGGRPFTLTGTATDADGTVASVEWKRGATVIGTSNTLNLTAPLLLTQTTDTLTFTATDNLGGVSTADTIVVTYLPAMRRLKLGGVIVPVMSKSVG